MTETEARVREALRTVQSLTLDPALETDPTVPLREVGITSATLISLLVEIESVFGLEWDDDDPPETFVSIESLARHVDGRTSGGRS